MSDKPFDVAEYLEVRLNSRIKENPQTLDDFYCTYQFEIGEGVWNLDLTSTKERTIKRGAHEAPDCTIIMSAEHFHKMLKRELNIMMALMTGKIKIKGDKTLALKLGDLFK